MEIVKAEEKDLERIAAFYKYCIDGYPDIYEHARWVYGLHPGDDMILEYIREEYFWLLEDEGKIVACGGFPLYQTSEYRNISWGAELEDNDVVTIHILVVDPVLSGKGLGHKMLSHAVSLAKENGLSAVRIDTLITNKPARRVYEHFGFKYRGTQFLNAGNTGGIDFIYLEYLLED